MVVLGLIVFRYVAYVELVTNLSCATALRLTCPSIPHFAAQPSAGRSLFTLVQMAPCTASR